MRIAWHATCSVVSTTNANICEENHMAKATKEEIVSLETEYWNAMKSKDGGRASQLSGKVTLTTSACGVTSIPKAKMSKMTEEGKWTLEAYEFNDVQVIVPSDDVAIIAYTVTQKVTMEGKKQQLHAADTSTWVRGADGWECHAHSETFLQDKSAQI